MGKSRTMKLVLTGHMWSAPYQVQAARSELVNSGTITNALSFVSQASPAPPYLKRGLHMKAPSPPNPTLKPSYSQVVKTKIPPHDPEKWARDPSPTLVTIHNHVTLHDHMILCTLDMPYVH